MIEYLTVKLIVLSISYLSAGFLITYRLRGMILDETRKVRAKGHSVPFFEVVLGTLITVAWPLLAILMIAGAIAVRTK